METKMSKRKANVSASERSAQSARRARGDPWRMPWDEWLIGLCYWVAKRSHDVATQHGAVLVDSSHRVLGLGYNGYPRGCMDADMPTDRPEKYGYIVHAEANCLLNSNAPWLHGCNIGNAVGFDRSTLGGILMMYITGFPCLQCFCLMMQCGVRRVVYGNVESECISDADRRAVERLAKDRNIALIAYVRQP